MEVTKCWKWNERKSVVTENRLLVVGWLGHCGNFCIQLFMAETVWKNAFKAESEILYGWPCIQAANTFKETVRYRLHIGKYRVFRTAAPRGKVGANEVDFVALKDGNYEYYQVAASIMDESVFKREISPLKNIKDNYPKKILTNDTLVWETIME